MGEHLAKAIHLQAQACADLGAPFSAAILRHAVADVEAGGIVAGLLTPWNGVAVADLVRDAVALRLLAALHYLVLDGRAPALAAQYPSKGHNPDRAWAAAQAALAASADAVAAMLTHEPQTNEVRRSACMLGGFLTIGQETGLPLRCFELGASAGLNSLWDRFRYDIGGATWGDPLSPVVLPCRWDGHAPSLAAALTVIERYACDRRPVDLRRPDDAVRLLSYCWAEQHERMERLRAAIALAQASPVDVDACQAAQWVAGAVPRDGTATVVFHSIVWQYIPAAEQAAILATMHAHAATATAHAPFHWLRMELSEAAGQFELRLWDWQSRGDRRLAVVHPHGEWARWC
ncbi:DUF2332 domain-containing protein [Sphingobium sufflavum]|nr:DUF2332 domain-containing protein [Sphingobium sufflavum]